jgi:hypothetical protein
MSYRAACLEGCDIFGIDFVEEEHGFLMDSPWGLAIEL